MYIYLSLKKPKKVNHDKVNDPSTRTKGTTGWLQLVGSLKL